MMVKDVLTQPVVTCRPETNLAAAVALMWENDCGVLPVVTETGELAGILTDRDICIALGTRNTLPSGIAVREVMGTALLVCKPTDHVRSALQIMRHAQIRRLPVVSEDGVLEGVVSISDILLSARRGLAMAAGAPGVSNADLVTALQAIYFRGDRGSVQPAAA